jgi:hypothetical protein
MTAVASLDMTRRPDRIHIALFTPGYPYVDAAVRAVELARRQGARFSRSIGEPLSLHRDQFARGFLESDATHALLLEGDVVPPADVLERLLAADTSMVTAVYHQWVDERLATSVQAVTDRTWSEKVAARIFPVRRCRLGCVLLRRDLFVRVPGPWFLSTMTAAGFVADDEWFCGAVRNAGVPILCDGSVICASLRQGVDLLAIAGGNIRRT